MNGTFTDKVVAHLSIFLDRYRNGPPLSPVRWKNWWRVDKELCLHFKKDTFSFFRIRSGPPAQLGVEGVLEDTKQMQTLVEPSQQWAGALPFQPRKRASSNCDLHSWSWRPMAHHSATSINGGWCWLPSLPYIYSSLYAYIFVNLEINAFLRKMDRAQNWHVFLGNLSGSTHWEPGLLWCWQSTNKVCWALACRALGLPCSCFSCSCIRRA